MAGSACFLHSLCPYQALLIARFCLPSAPRLLAHFSLSRFRFNLARARRRVSLICVFALPRSSALVGAKSDAAQADARQVLSPATTA